MKSHVALTVCAICGKDDGIVLDKKMRAILPPKIIGESPCEKCCQDLDSYKEMGFILLVADDDFDQAGKQSPWTYFRWLSVIKHEAATSMFSQLDMSKGVAWITVDTAKSIGIEDPKEGKN